MCCVLHAQESHPWDEEVQELKFSDSYITNLMKWFKLKRRKNTREDKKIPDAELVRQHMSQRQAFIAGTASLNDSDGNEIYPQVVGGFTDVQVCNFDESGICPLSPTHQYLPATSPQSQPSLREEVVAVQDYVDSQLATANDKSDTNDFADTLSATYLIVSNSITIDTEGSQVYEEECIGVDDGRDAYDSAGEEAGEVHMGGETNIREDCDSEAEDDVISDSDDNFFMRSSLKHTVVLDNDLEDEDPLNLFDLSYKKKRARKLKGQEYNKKKHARKQKRQKSGN